MLEFYGDSMRDDLSSYLGEIFSIKGMGSSTDIYLSNMLLSADGSFLIWNIGFLGSEFYRKNLLSLKEIELSLTSFC